MAETYAQPTQRPRMPFDARAAKLLEPGRHFTIPECPGLRFQSSTTGRAWIYRYRNADGAMRQVKIGAWPAVSYNGAVVEWERLRDARGAGRDPATEKRAARRAEVAEEAARKHVTARSLTVRSLCELYLQGHIERNRKAKGAAEVRRLFDTMLGDLAEADPAAVTRTQAFELLQSHAETPVVASNLRRELGAAWDYGLDAGRLGDNTPNWWRLVMRGKLRSRGRTRQGELVGTSKRVLSSAELALLLPWLPNFSRTVEDALTLYLWTGSRGAEIMAIHATEITDEGDGLWWTIPKAKTKNGWREDATDVRVPLVGRAERVIRRRLTVCEGGYLFASRGKVGYVEQKAVGVAVWTSMPYAGTRPEQVRPRLPVQHWAPHDLRRTVRTQLAALGCAEDVAEAVIGHMPSGGVGTYNLHRYDNERREWLTKLDKHLEHLIARPCA